MGLSDLLSDWVKVVKLAAKPTWKEYRLTLRIILLGMGLLGTLGFFFQFMGTILEFASVQAVPREYALMGGIIAAAAVVLIAIYMRSRSSI